MKNLTALFLATIMTACGGSSSSSNSAPAAPALPVAPAISASAVMLSNANIDIAGIGGDFLIQAASGVNVTVSGSSNKVDFSPNQVTGIVSITGVSNTIITRPGNSATYLYVTGTSNTFWVPDGLHLVIDNPSPPAITIITYAR